MIQAKRYHDISCGHRVVGHEGKCKNLHGHNYRITFTVEGALDSVGRVLDFGVIKTKLCDWLEREWDHRTLLWWKDPFVSPSYQDRRNVPICLDELDPTIVIVPFNPTAENIAKYLVEVVGPCELIGTGAKLVACEVEETRKCSAIYEI